MTVIAWDGKTLAADKQGTNGGLPVTVVKAWRQVLKDPVTGEYFPTLLACAGEPGVALALREWYAAGHGDPADFPPAARDKVASLVVITALGASLYSDSPYPEVREDPFFALGSGRDFAVAAMHLGKSAREAVEIASLFDVYCGRGVTELTLAPTT